MSWVWLAALDSFDSQDRTLLTRRLLMSIMLHRVILSSYGTNIQSNASGIIASVAKEVKGTLEKTEPIYQNKEDADRQ